MDSPIWTKDECGADAITKLINQGMDLTQREPFQNVTVLHFWAGMPYDANSSNQEDSLGVVKLLIEKGADLQALDRWGFTPLLEAANGRHGECPNLMVFDYLLETDNYSRAQKIEAMELAGAVILSNGKNDSQFQKAFDYWRKALQLRQMDVEGCGPIQKTRLHLKTVQTTEWITSEELEDVIGHPETYMIQSFLVRLRIFFYKSWEAIESLYWFFLRDNCFSEMRKKRRVIEIFDIIWAMMETISHFDPSENSGVELMVERIVGKLFRVLTCLLTDSPDTCNAEIIETSFYLIVSTTGLQGINLDPSDQLFNILSHLSYRLLNKGTMESLSKLRNQRGRSLLHNVFFFGEIFHRNPDANNLYTIVRVLLNAGCDPNAIDGNGYTPLHYLVLIEKRILKDSMTITARLLLDFGAQLTLKNADGKTAVDLWIQFNGRKRRRNDDEEGEIIEWMKLPEWCSEMPTLTSLCARVIRRNRIPHLGLPATLIPIIEKHKITQ